MIYPIRIVLVVKSSIFLLLLISGCNMMSEEAILKEAAETAQITFEEKLEDVKPNLTYGHTSIYIPERLTVIEQDESNIVLSDDEQLYIVFINLYEEPSSKLHFTSAQTDQAILLKSFKNEKMFGFVRVMPEEDEKYELQVGIGGVKITTYTEKRKIVTDTKDLMEIAQSIVHSDEK